MAYVSLNRFERISPSSHPALSAMVSRKPRKSARAQRLGRREATLRFRIDGGLDGEHRLSCPGARERRARLRAARVRHVRRHAHRGTAERGVESLDPDPATTERIVQAHARVFSGMKREAEQILER